MGTVEPRSKDVAGDCEPATEQAKAGGSKEERSHKEAIHGGLGLEGSVAGTYHDVVKVSSNGKKNSDGCNDSIGSGAAFNVVKATRAVQTKVSVERGNDEDMDVDISGINDGYGLGDSDMKGVSSLLKMRGSLWQRNYPNGGGYEEVDRLDLGLNYAKRETAGVDVTTSGHDVQLLQAMRDGMQDVGGCKRDVSGGGVVQENGDLFAETRENKDMEVDDGSYEGCNFSLGDFVWGKIKSHPWWPGRIYDPADASEYAAKLKLKNRHLVAYFGDGTFAWCHPSQLKPFEGNFKEMVKQSNSRAFINAVQGAVSEFGRVLESKMTSILTKASQHGTGQPLAQNYGIKEGVLVPESGSTWKLATTLVEPVDLLSGVRRIGEVMAVTNVLELEIIRCHLSAVYYSRGGYSLPIYHEPQPVVGLEDTSDDASSKGTASYAVEFRIQGACKEQGTSKVDGTSQTMLRKCPALSDDRTHPRRKQKSIAEIMGGGESIDAKRKGVQPEQIVNMQSTPSGEKKRNRLEESSDSREGRKPDPGSGQTAGVDGSGKFSDEVSLSVLKKSKGKIEINTDGAPRSGEEAHGDFSFQSTEQINNEPSSRERKKSRYLSPPFTNINRSKRKKNIETDTKEVFNEALQSEQMSTGLGHLTTTTPTSSTIICNEVPQTVSDLAPGGKPVDKSTLQSPEQELSRAVDLTNIMASPLEVLSEICSAAVSTQFAPGLCLSDKVGRFIYTFRSSIYRDGSLYKVYSKRRPGKKRKNSESALVSSQKNKNQNGENQSNTEPEKKRVKKANPDAQKQKSSISVKPGAKGSDKKAASPAALFVTFGPGSPLPSKADLINIFGRFGGLSETETDMFYNNFCARVTFMKSSDAEEAFRQSQRISPFGTSSVNFHLQHSSSAAKISERKERSKPKSALHATEGGMPKMFGSGTPTSQSSQLLLIRENLQTMNNMVQTSEGEVSPGMRTRLENEINVLLEKVNAMVESSSSR